MLLTRELLSEDGRAGLHPLTALRYGWTDSSPQIRRNWLLTQYHYIKQEEAVALFDAVCELSLDASSRLASPDPTEAQ
eukprot:6107504-Alexandrium_andersonii.AAC.1